MHFVNKYNHNTVKLIITDIHNCGATFLRD